MDKGLLSKNKIERISILDNKLAQFTQKLLAGNILLTGIE